MPDLMTRLDQVVLPAEFRGTTKELLEGVAHEAHLEIEFPKTAVSLASLQLLARPNLRYFEGEKSASFVLERVLGDRIGLIVKPDRLRIVPREEMEEFWKHWAGSYNKNK